MHRQSSHSLSKFLTGSPYRQTPIPKLLSKSLPAVSSQTASQTFSPINTTVSGRPISKLRLFLLQSSSIALANFATLWNPRNYGALSAGEFDVNKIVDQINLKFAEAREEIEAAMESKETVYFDEEAECARAAVKEVLEMFEGLLGRLEERQREALQRSMGLKIEQLKAEIQQLND
ncbi:hypothetical protein Nepgr_018891 [Nepenthes gracilis]|uniref:Uncharacterized protein n=1 Tax=Nepenthes gracilis TaxID=150966 RepID=A0AAD3SU95_NEPGR|nr:hypothetical protein Nepgr_018891 [Nepenthes gracilis]